MQINLLCLRVAVLARAFARGVCGASTMLTLREFFCVSILMRFAIEATRFATDRV